VLFNSLVFAVAFLPATLLLLAVLARWRQSAAVAWLGIASLAFYSWTEWHYLALLLASIGGNYLVGLAIVRAHDAQQARASRRWLVAGLVFDLGLLGYYKYAGLIARTAEALTGTPLGFVAPILPIGISFFTFTQIAFLVDASHGEVKDKSFARYLLFVTYFPHLIAGPILHHAAMMPQFAARSFGRIGAADLRAGLAIFLVGLLKKVVLADEAAQYVAPVFGAAADPRLTAPDAWIGVLAYTCQIYFDFSGYSDMAIGLSRMMRITLPENFNSPYKSTSIIEFWRRWHISLSSFLRDYLYIPLGGNRHGPARRHLNLMITMLLGGLWHGASWTFLVWGGLHGLYLTVNHVWRQLVGSGPATGLPARSYALMGWLLTMLCVITAWVFFRAPDFETAAALLKSMYGLAAHPEPGRAVSFNASTATATIAVCAFIALALPNTLELRRRWQLAATKAPWLSGTPAVWCLLGALVSATLWVTLMAESAAARSAFIYFSF
jgi:D-alanyl-lipoteichoic acid acyltransferase DltB (MBOAT superfamily)